GPRGEDLLLEGELEAGVDREAEVRAGRPRVLDDGGVRDGPTGHVALRVHDPRTARQVGVVVLLNAVLADAVAVDEAEELRGERRIGPAALVGIDAHRLRLEHHPPEHLRLW